MSETNREMTLRFLAQPMDVNFGGNVHGGTVMKWIDQAGYACVTAWSGEYCVTASVGSISFHSPIRIGDLVEARARIIYTGRSSMHVLVEIRACNPRHCELNVATRCIIVFVAVDGEGKPTEVPAWTPEEEEDKGLERYALQMMEARKAIEREVTFR